MPADYPFLLPPGAIAAWRAAIEAMKDPALRRATTNALPAPNDFDVYVARVESVLEGAVHGKTAR
jgi:hypothetical protein